MGLFGFLKRSGKDESNPAGIPLTVDMHSHLLVGIDDGSQSMEDSIEMIKRFQKLGYTKLCTTPHVMGDFYKNTPEIINAKLDELKAELKTQNIDIEISAAGEYSLDEWFQEKVKTKELLTIGSNYVLIETTFLNEPANFDQMLFDMRIGGYQPVLAHPERYVYFHDDMKKYDRLFEKEVLFAVNILSFTGYYSPQIKRAADYLLANKMIHFLGSDVHNMKHLDILDEFRKGKTYQKLLQLPLMNNSL